MDEHLRHACDEMGMGRKSRVKIEQHGICTLDDVLERKEEIKRGELPGLMQEVREKLLFAADWKVGNPDKDFLEEFDENARFAKEYIGVALGAAFSEGNVPLYNDIDNDGQLLEEVIQQSRNIVMEAAQLRKACGKFEYDSFLDKAIRHFHSLVGRKQCDVPEKTFIVAGRTQAGKTAVKAVIQSMCGLLKIPLIILTKGVDESIDLHCKLVGLAEGTQIQKKHVVVASSKHDRLGYRMKNVKINEALEGGTHGGTLVIADTKPQVLNKACKAIKEYRKQIPGGKFILIVDEADAMFRTVDKHQVFEKALQQLLGLNPSMTVMISATPVPFMLDLINEMDKSADNIEFFNLEPQDEYVGIEDIVPLEIDGKKVYLEQNELTYKSSYTSDGVTVCNANEKNIALYDDALSDMDNRKGVLVLDCSCPRVYAVNNIKDKATAVQELYRRRGKASIVITFSGRGIAVKYPHKDWDHESWRKKLIGDVLQHIDEAFGLGMPVFIFGYAKMRRGISFRSSNRVPTHMIMALGRGHNISNMVQTLGRITFNGRSVLKDNGFDGVTVLTTSNDLTVCLKKQKYIEEVSKRIKSGDTFADAVTGANQRLPDSANFLRHTFRELGGIRGMRAQFEEWVLMEDVPKELSPDEEETKEKFWHDTDAQKLLQSLARLRKGHQLVHPDDVIDDLKEAEDYQMTKKKLRELLRKFCDKNLVSKDKDGMFKVPPPDRLTPFMNPDVVEMPDLFDDDEQSFEAENVGSSRPPLREVSTDSPYSSLGTRENPIVLYDSSDDECSTSISSITMANTTEGGRSHAAKIVTPEKVVDTLISEPESFVGKRIAKTFWSKPYFGRVVEYIQDRNLWHITYDDGDEEDFDKNDMRKALRLYRKQQNEDHSKPSSLSETSLSPLFGEPLTNIDDIPEVWEDDTSKRRTVIEEPEKKRRVYYTDLRCTPTTIAKRFKVDVRQILRDNKRREGYENLKRNSTFDYNSPIVLPLKNDE